MSAPHRGAALIFLNPEYAVNDTSVEKPNRKRRSRFGLKIAIASWNAWQIRIALWGGALAVGLAATLFAKAADLANEIFHKVLEQGAWIPLILTPVGLMGISWLTRNWFPGTQGSGIPQALAALEAHSRDGLRGKMLSLRIAFGKIFLTLLGLGVGASIGREGPTVHVGASIMYALGKKVRFSPHYLEKALILGGGSAGIAAAFNTPIAGIVFAIEELSRSFEQKTNGIVLTAVIFAGVTAQAVLGNYNYFGTSSAIMVNWQDWLAIPLGGIIGGFLGGAFSQILVSGSEKLAPLRSRYPMWIAAVCGLSIAIVGLSSGGLTYGTGYKEASDIIHHASSDIGFGYPIFKFFASVASYLSGIPGGIFAPSLAAGAGVGADIAHAFPQISTDVLILLGMVGYFTGVVQSPITGFIIVMEMTDNHSMLLPLMATSFLANGVSKLVCKKPIYHALAAAFLPPRKV